MFSHIKHFILLILSFYIILISLRPSYPNPSFILHIHKNPIYFILLAILAIFSFSFDFRIGLLLLIIIIGIYFDIICIIKRDATSRPSIDSFYNIHSNRQ